MPEEVKRSANLQRIWSLHLPLFDELDLRYPSQGVAIHFCEITEILANAYNAIGGKLIVKGYQDNPVLNPAARVFRDFSQRYTSLAKDLGISPEVLKSRYAKAEEDDEPVMEEAKLVDFMAG